MTEAMPHDVAAPAVAILSDGPELDIVERGGRAIALAWPGMGSRHRSMHRIELAAGGSTRALAHPSEGVYLVAEGAVSVEDLHAGTTVELARYGMVYVPRRTGYRFVARDAAVLVGGPCPPDPALYGWAEPHPIEAGAGDGPLETYDAEGGGVPVPMIARRAWLVVWPGTGAEVATMNLVMLDPGEQNRPHTHQASDDTIAILAGAGSIDDLTNGVNHVFTAGDAVFVRQGIEHMVKADRGVEIVSAGGPCPPDFGMLRALGLVE